MLTSLREDGLGLHREIVVGILQVQVRIEGGDAVAQRHAGGIDMPWLYREHVHSETRQEAVVVVVDSEIYLGSLAVLDIVGGGRRSDAVDMSVRSAEIRAGGSILHLPDGGKIDGEIPELIADQEQRRAAERVERRAGI